MEAESMDIGVRAVVRVFLLVGGLAFAIVGGLEGSGGQVAFGVFAALLGGFGLWWRRRESTTE
jgi:hypothetical protein